MPTMIPLTAGAVGLLTLAVGLYAEVATPTFLAAVSREGSLIPIATFDGREWWNRWPWGGDRDEIRSLPIPPSLEAIPGDWLPPATRLPSEWRMLRLTGGTVPLRAVRPTRPAGWNTMETIAILSDYRMQGDEAYAGDEIGVAIAGPGQLGRFVTPSRRETNDVLGKLRGRLAALEELEIAKWKKQWFESQGNREAPSLKPVRWPDSRPDDPIFGLVRADSPIDGRTYYYLDGEKLFLLGVKDQPEGCKLNLSFEGVVIAARDGRVLSDHVSAHAYAEYCGDRSSWSTPLATVRLGGRVWWIMNGGVEDGYDYILFDPDANESVTLKGTWALRKGPWSLQR